MDLEVMGKAAKEASRVLYNSEESLRNRAIEAIANALTQHQEEILNANEEDLAQARKKGLSRAMLDRLMLSPERLQNMADEARNVMALADPIGIDYGERQLPNDLQIRRRRVPLGVVGVIYEARPNVTVDIAVLCLKSGNAVILRGGKETLKTNQILAGLIQQAIAASGLPEEAVQLIASPDREWVGQLLRLDRYVDMIIPRGGAELHRRCREESTIPVITGGIGVCHLYVDSFCDLDLAIPVIVNAKVQRPTVCNALDTLLIHHLAAADVIPELAKALAPTGVEIRADITAYDYFADVDYPRLLHSTHEDFGTEFLGLILSVKLVTELDEALEHIAEYSSGHSDGILTLRREHAERFLNEVDSAAVYVNASTRFTDGAQFGLGAEVAVSTQKLHARGPMALEGLTTYKWLVEGRWTVRP